MALRATGATLREATLRLGTEFGALIDSETGEQLGETITGIRHEIDLTRLLRQAALDRRYVCLHTHPDSTSFSPSDLVLLLEEPLVVANVAVGADGTWYLGSFAPELLRPSPGALYRAYKDAYEALLDGYVRRRAAGELTRRQAARAHTHEVWLQIGPALGVRYDRLESG